MRMTSKHQWEKLAQWSPQLFILAAVFLFIGAANSGLAFLSDAYPYDEWHGIVLEFGRLAALLGTAGLSVQVVERNARLGKLNRAVASLAVVFVTALIVLATLAAAGVFANPPGIIGLVAYVLSVSTFLVTGIGVIRTGAHSRWVGRLLLVNVVALLVVFFGRLFVPLGLVATVIPAIQVLLYFSVGHYLKVESATSRQAAPATDTIF